MNVHVENISVDLGAKPAKRILDNVSFEANDGEFLSLLGASGAGKSTLLKIIAGILFQDSGTIAFDGKPVDALPSHKRHVGFVFQDTRLFPNMNVEENVAFPCKMAKMPKKERLDRARYLLSCVHLEGYGDRDVSSLSGGQQQRVALARALAGRPNVLLLDEPFSGLDENLRDEMRSLVLKLHRDFAITTIMVTHDAVEALEMSDRIAYISEGEIIQVGTSQDLFENPKSHEVAACFGECSVLEGNVAAEQFRCGGLSVPAHDVACGDAQAVLRYAGLSVAKAGADAEGELLQVERSEDGKQARGVEGEVLPVRCCVYRGDGYLLRLDVDGQTLTVPSETSYAPGAMVAVNAEPGSFFVYPAEGGRTDGGHSAPARGDASGEAAAAAADSSEQADASADASGQGGAA